MPIGCCRSTRWVGSAEPDDVAAAVAFLASADAAWITGHVLPVDGADLVAGVLEDAVHGISPAGDHHVESAEEGRRPGDRSVDAGGVRDVHGQAHRTG